MSEGASITERQTDRLDIPPRVILENVPYIGFKAQRTGGTIEDTPFCSAMRSALASLGNPCSYGFLMGVSGAAFRFAWNAEYLDGGNLSTQHMGADPTDHIRRAFRAVGWVPRIIGNLSWQRVDGSQLARNAIGIPDFLGRNIEYQDEAFFRDWIVEELGFRGYPMLALGVLIPPECCILAGYDEGGHVLIGWAHSQDWPDNQASDKVSFEPSGHFRKRDWFNDTGGLIGFHDRTDKPAMPDTYRSAVGWAVKLGRTERFGRYYSGLAAYLAWAAMLKEDDAFAVADAGALDWRLMCHHDALAATWEGRMHAVEFLRSGARLLPQWSVPYEEAARIYSAEVTTFEKIADVLGGFGSDPERAQKLAQAENRAAIISLIVKAQEQDESAIAQLEKT